MATGYEFYRYCDSRGEWRWRFRSPNGRTMADSGEGYSSLEACDRAIAVIQQQAASAALT